MEEEAGRTVGDGGNNGGSREDGGGHMFIIS